LYVLRKFQISFRRLKKFGKAWAMGLGMVIILYLGEPGGMISNCC